MPDSRIKFLKNPNSNNNSSNNSNSNIELVIIITNITIIDLNSSSKISKIYNSSNNNYTIIIITTTKFRPNALLLPNPRKIISINSTSKESKFFILIYKIKYIILFNSSVDISNLPQRFQNNFSDHPEQLTDNYISSTSNAP